MGRAAPARQRPLAGAGGRAGRGRGLSLRIAALPDLPEVRPGDDLGELLASAAPPGLADSDVLVVAHKVVSKAEGRLRRLDEVEPGGEARRLGGEQGKDPRLVQVVLDESAEMLRAERGVMICVTRHGFVCANAGVDASNAPAGEVVLLPLDPDASARGLRARIGELRGVRPAVVVSDSFGRAWRVGQTDVAVGAAGIVPVDDWRGRRDSGGRELRATAIAAADSIAGAADLARAKDSRRPAVLVSGLGRLVTEADGPGAAALRREREQDLFR
ncbi:MAG TPA: coenzyme F420-0:L-glutamate ligase [Thermoleophilaceae bacterium]